MGAPTRYESTDTSAPVLTGQVGSAINLFNKCLVEGYGSKAAAGWTKPYTGTNLAVYRNAVTGTNRYIRVDDTQARETRLRAYATMSAVSTGTGPAPSAGGYQRFHKSNTASADSRAWTLLADDRTCLLFVEAIPAPSNYHYPAPIYFGDIKSFSSADTHHFSVIAEDSSLTADHAYAPTSGLSALYPSLLSSAEVAASVAGFAVGTYANVAGARRLGFSSQATYSTLPVSSGHEGSPHGPTVVAMGGPIAGRVVVSDSLNGLRGILRGLMATANAVPKTDRSVFADLSGYAGSVLPVTIGSYNVSRGQIFALLGDWD